MNAWMLCWQLISPSEPCPPVDPVAELASANEIPAKPPASASVPVMVTCAPAGTAAFSGESGWRNPGVSVSTAVAVTVLFTVAVTTTCTRSAVK